MEEGVVFLLKRTLATYLVAYLILFAIVCVIFIPIINKISDDAYQQSLIKSQREVSELVDNMSNQLNNYSQTASVLSVNQDLLMLTISNNYVSSIVNAMRVKRQLYYYVGVLDQLESCLLFINNSHFIISPDFISMDMDKAYDVMISFDGMSLDDVYTHIVNNKKTYSVIRVASFQNEGAVLTEDCLLFIMNVSLNIKTVGACSFVFVIPTEKFVGAKKGILEDASYALLTDSEGNILYSQGGEDALQLAEYKAGDSMVINGQPCVVLEEATDWMGLHLWTGIEKAQIQNGNKLISNFILPYLAVGLVCIAGLCAIYALYHYSGVRQLVILGESITDIRSDRSSAYSYVKEIMNEVSKQNKEMFFKYTQTDNAYLNSMLMNACVHGVYSSSEIKALKPYVGDLQSFCFIIVQYHPDPEEKTINALIEKETSLFQFFEGKAISFHPRPYCTYYIIETDEKPSELKKRFLEKLESSDWMGKIDKIGISDILSGIEMIQNGYHQASFSLYSSEKDEKVFVYEPDEKFEGRVNIPTLNRLNDLILYGKRAEVETFLAELRHALHSQSGHSEQMNEIFYSMQMVLNNLAEELKVEFTIAEDEPLISMRRINREVNLLLEVVESRKHRNSTAQNEKLVAIIEQNLDDPALNAAKLAEMMGVSEKYVYTIIKDRFGKSLGAYLEEQRIKKADELLISSALSNEQIAETVGFASLTTFYRAFRKIHGLSPAAWRSSLKAMEENGSHKQA